MICFIVFSRYCHPCRLSVFTFFCFKDPATTEIYTYGHPLSLPDSLPIFGPDEIAEVACTFDVMIMDEESERSLVQALDILDQAAIHVDRDQDRKSTRLNSSH